MWTLLGPAIALAAGAGLGGGLEVERIACLAVLALATGACGWAFHANRGAVALAAACAGAAAAGIELGRTALSEVLEAPVRRALGDRPGTVDGAGPDAPVVLAGTLVGDADPTAAGAAFVLAAAAIVAPAGVQPVEGRLRVSVAGDLARRSHARWRDGRTVVAPLFPRLPLPFRNPGLGDQDVALARRGLSLLASVKSAALVEVAGRGPWYREVGVKARDVTRQGIARAVGPDRDRSAAVIGAILIGDRAGLDADLRERLQRAGTFHVIAISGGNIAVLAALCFGGLRLAAVPRAAASVGTAAALVAYSLMVQGGASVARATAMAVAWLLARAADHRPHPVGLLASTALVLVVSSPLMAFDPGFALTCGATLGILVGVPRAARAIGRPAGEARTRAPSTRHARRPLGAAAGLAAATVCAELAVGPVTAVAFSMVTAAGLVLNFVAVPAMVVIQIAGMASLAAGVLHEGVSRLCALVAHGGVEALVRSASIVDAVPWAARRVPPPSLPVVVMYYVALATALATGSRRSIRVAATCLAATCLVTIWTGRATADGAATSPPPALARRALLSITVLDVGQGDATLVAFPGGGAMLVDAGGLPGSTFDVGARVVAPALWALGVRELDTLVLTHGDPDHVGGGPSLVDDFRPARIWEGVPVPGHAAMAALRELARRKRLVWRTVRAGEQYHVHGTSLAVRHPPAPGWERRRVRNDDSVVLEIRYGETSFVLPGDAGFEVERRIARGIAPAAVRILKAGHHGSAGATSREWLAMLRPQAVVVSAGRGNRFGHPAPSTIERCRELGARVFRTDRLGAIQALSDGRILVLRAWDGRRWVDQARYGAAPATAAGGRAGRPDRDTGRAR